MNKEITLYTRTICGTCMFIKNQLNMKEIEFTEVNIDKQPDKAEPLRQAGLMSAPVMEVDGQFYVGGEIMGYLEG